MSAPCTKAAARAAMADDEFWADVYPADCGGEEPPIDTVPLEVEPCPVCESTGACAYDAEGRPLIHTDSELPE